jgi:hypothetical protein
MLNALAMIPLFITLMLKTEPVCKVPVTESVEPKRATARRDMELPKEMNDNADMADPTRDTALTLSDDPILTESRTEAALPSWAKDLRLIELPIVIIFRILIPVPIEIPVLLRP